MGLMAKKLDTYGNVIELKKTRTKESLGKELEITRRIVRRMWVVMQALGGGMAAHKILEEAERELYAADIGA